MVKQIDSSGNLIWLEGNIPALKNSKVKAKKGIFSSPTVKKFLKKIGIQSYSSSKKTVKGYVDKTRPNQFEQLRNQFEEAKKGKEYPVFIGFHFVRESKRLFDFGNATEIIFDLLTAHDIIPDDNVSFIFPTVITKEGILPTQTNIREHSWYSVDKEKPGVFMKIF